MNKDNLIIGYSKTKIDNKGRINLPKYFNPEPNKEVIIKKEVLAQEFGLRIYHFDEYYQIIEKLLILKDNTKELEENIKITLKIQEICKELEQKIKIDAKKRILIPKLILDEINFLSQDEILFRGEGDSLLIRKTKK